MQYCRICKCVVELRINIYKETFGEPPVLLVDLIKECVEDFFRDDYKDAGQEENESYICHECCQKLLIYYNSSLTVTKIKHDLRKLMESGTIQRFGRPELFDKEHENIVDTEVENGNVVNTGINSYITNVNELANTEEYEVPDKEKQLMIVEYIGGNTEISIEDHKADLEFEHLPEVVKTELTSDNEESCEFIEIEKLNIDELNKHSLKVANRKYRKNYPELRNPISCPDCRIMFPNKRTYSVHRKQEHFSGYICDQCGKTFYSQSGFITHAQTHKPVKEFVCPVCGEQYHHKGYLKRHMAWHSGETPFECDICSKRFVHKVALYKHKQIHENIRNIECLECGFKFRTKAHLNRHMMTHTGAKPHSCPVCGKCFSQMYNMKVHLKEHESPGSTRRSRIKCKNCGKTFSHKDKFDDHIKCNEC